MDFDSERKLRRALTYNLAVSFKKSHAHTKGTFSIPEDIQAGSNYDQASDDDFDSDLDDALQAENKLDPNFDWVVTNLDAASSVEQTLEEELKRLLILKSYLILDAQPENSFERLTSLACRIWDVPISNVTLVDLGRSWFMSNRGLGQIKEVPRNTAFCAHALLTTQDIMVIPNTRNDFRFKDSPAVTGPLKIGFYAACPLVTPEGVKLGTFW